jgi:hypothetical protein
MKRVVISGLIAGIILLLLNILGLYTTIWLFPGIATQYFSPAFNAQPGRYIFYYTHPFVISMALAWFWNRFKDVLKGSYLTRGITFGLVYVLIAIFPMLWLIYSAMDVTIAIVLTWLAFALVQGVVAGLVFEKINP